jgi:methylphosphotriester-DNA--protein-cysteine methyltransferase
MAADNWRSKLITAGVARSPNRAMLRAVGFDDPYHFSRVFKQIHGVAPRDFKRGGGPSSRKRK